MNRYGKAGLVLLGIGGLAGFISLLGGPNVFSTFSSSISTLFPEAETPAKEDKPQEKLEETPVVAKAEEPQKIEEIAQAQIETEVDSPVVGQEETKEPEQLIVEPPTPPKEEGVEKLKSVPTQVEKSPVASVSVSPKPKLPDLPSVSSLLRGIGQLFQGSSTSSSRKATGQDIGGKKHKASKKTQGSGSKAGGMWCGTSSQAFIMEEGGTCMGWKLEGEKWVRA